MLNAVLQRLVDERTHVHEQIDLVLAGAVDEDRDPSESEQETLKRLRSRAEELEPQIDSLLETEEVRQRAKDARGFLTRATPAKPDEGKPEPEANDYESFAHYARDLVLTRSDRVGHSVPVHIRHAAAERLERAVSQVLTADVGPLIQPQYIAQIMQLIDRARPLVNASNRIGLASGKLEWPRITEVPEVGVQATEKTEAGDGSMTVDVMNTVAKTYLVAANFSWQTIQWSNPDALRLWFDLAGASYARQTDAAAAAVIEAADTTPTPVASADLEGWMAAIAAAAGEVYANTGRFPDTVAAAPDVGFALLGLVSGTAPVFVATGAGNFGGNFPAIGGLRFVISNALTAGTAIVGDFSALLSAETPGSPVEARVVEPSIGGLEVGIIGAFACAITDPGAFAELTAPAGP
jgi:HK97 family phage major capsid protein